jgi:ATP-dependent Lon protease
VHLPEGAIHKEGPSAGITLATALISAFTNRPVRHDLVMTGEITLHGRVIPIGGLKEKVMAARRVGIRNIIMPAKNKQDLIEVPRKARKDLNVILVERMDQVLDAALLPAKVIGTRVRKRAEPKAAQQAPVVKKPRKTPSSQRPQA